MNKPTLPRTVDTETLTILMKHLLHIFETRRSYLSSPMNIITNESSSTLSYRRHHLNGVELLIPQSWKDGTTLKPKLLTMRNSLWQMALSLVRKLPDDWTRLKLCLKRHSRRKHQQIWLDLLN